ncbi:hypothetical protein B0H14DRAFT_2836145 [Mycena olivaceomarginata]|nr:hypothetical protein B0H14DRAFT_2836145 [Mycena olivaceomarginata]
MIISFLLLSWLFATIAIRSFFLVSCDATTPRSFSFSVLTTRCILHAHTLTIFLYVPVPKHSL